MWLWLGVLALMLLGSGAIGYKLYRRAQAKKLMQWEGKMVLATPEGMPVEKLAEWAGEMDARMDRDEVVRPVVEELQLVSRWQLPDEPAAMERLKTSTRIIVENNQIVFAVRDKDKELITGLQKSLGQSYDRVVKAEQGLDSP